MEAPIIIEILDRFGKVKERHKLEEFPVRIGRSYRNDIIIDDQYVSPEHIEIMLDGDGHVLVNDLKSENGIYTLHPIKRHDVILVEENQRMRIGHTDIRIRSEAYPAKETIIDHGKPSQLHFMMTNVLLLPFVFALLAGILAADQYFQTLTEVSANQIMSAILPILIIVALWCLMWAVVSKIVTHSFYFSYHAVLVCLLLSGFYFIETGFEYIEFIFPQANTDKYLTIVSDLAFSILLLYGHLRQSTHFNKRKTRTVSIIAACIIVGVAYLFTFVSEPEFNDEPVFSSFIKPPMFAVKKAVNIDRFFEGTEKLADFGIEHPEK